MPEIITVPGHFPFFNVGTPCGVHLFLTAIKTLITLQKEQIIVIKPCNKGGRIADFVKYKDSFLKHLESKTDTNLPKSNKVYRREYSYTKASRHHAETPDQSQPQSHYGTSLTHQIHLSPTPRKYS